MTEEHGRGATLDQGTVYAHNRGARAIARGGGSGWGGSDGATRRRQKQMVAAVAAVVVQGSAVQPRQRTAVTGATWAQLGRGYWRLKARLGEGNEMKSFGPPPLFK